MRKRNPHPLPNFLLKKIILRFKMFIHLWDLTQSILRYKHVDFTCTQEESMTYSERIFNAILYRS